MSSFALLVRAACNEQNTKSKVRRPNFTCKFINSENQRVFALCLVKYMPTLKDVVALLQP